MLSWTPILIPAMLGLIVLYRRDRLFGGGLLLALLAYYYFIASYPDWDGISSFGNRFFVSLTPVFVIGLAAALDWLARWWKNPRAVSGGCERRDRINGAVEFWPDLSMGYAAYSQPGTHLLERRGA